MHLRLRTVVALGVVLVLVVTACGGDPIETGSTEALEEIEVTGGGDDAPPPTTFLPPLDGPFDLDGGADRGDDSDVIVDEDAPESFGPPLSQLAFPTDWTRRTVEDTSEFLLGLGGTDPRDGIPPIDDPIFETVTAAGEWLDPREPGALVRVADETRFYPLGMLTRHEIVNDAFGGTPVAVTFCPLCNTAITFDRRIDGDVLRFGVSGLLRNSDLVMWDDATTSLWQQATGEALIGHYAGSRLDIVPTAIVSFEQFATEFPDGRSLAAESGFGRGSYGVNPYSEYSSSERPFLFAGEIDDSYPALSRVVGVDVDGAARAYPFELLADRRVINDDVGGVPVVVWWGGDTADALDRRTIAESDAIGTGLALNPVVDGDRLDFEPGPVDGTFVDLQTGSTWSLLGRATDGELAGTELAMISHRNEFWFAWQAFFGAENVFEG